MAGLPNWERLRGARLESRPGREANAHIHLPPNFSAFETVEEVVRSALQQGLRVLGASNYYDYEVYQPFVDHCLQAGIAPILGMEVIAYEPEWAGKGWRVNDPGNPGKVYLCGKGVVGVASPNGSAAGTLASIRERDSQRMAEVILAMEGCLAHSVPTGLTSDEIVQQVASRHGVPSSTVVLQERHVAQAFQERIFELIPTERRASFLGELFDEEYPHPPDEPLALQAALRARLMKAGRPAFVPERYGPVQEAMTFVRELGGYPCYPILADGVNPMCERERDFGALVGLLEELGVRAVEFIPTRNSAALLEEWVPKLRHAGYAVSAGTEHNTLDREPLRPRARGGGDWSPRLEEVFWEGACVALAHQRRALNGQPGFEADGSIEQFAREGRQVVGDE